MLAGATAAHAVPVRSQSSATPPSSAFDAIRARAEAARSADRLEEALGLYARGVRLRPAWTEGHWYIGAIAYELERYAEGRAAFREVLRRQSGNGAARALKGLCEFKLGSYRAALDDLTRAGRLGVGDDAELLSVTAYHRAILQTRFEAYERALQTLGGFARGGQDTPAVIEAMGLAVLRIPRLPTQLPSGQREMVILAGRAAFNSAAGQREPARQTFEALAARYPNAPNVRYVFGLALLGDDPDRALEEFRAELRNSPRHAPAMVQIAQELLRRGDRAGAVPLAKDAVARAPHNFVARRVLGQLYLETGNVPGAIAQLETAASIEPESPSVHFNLAKAYQRAGRSRDATRERATFTRLERALRAQRGGASAVGDPEPARQVNPRSP